MAARASTRTRDAAATNARAAELAKKSLDDLYTVGRPLAAWRVLVYSDNGGGKTTFLAHVPGVFFLPVEDGAAQYRVPQWKGRLDTADALDVALDTLRHSKHAFQAVALETLDAVEELLKDRVEQRLRDSAEKDAPTTIAELNEREFGAGYDLIRDEWRMLLQRLNALREERGMHVLMSAHSKVDTVKHLDGKDHQRHAPQISGKKSANLITGWCDYVLRFEIEVGFALAGKKSIAVAGDRIMRCNPDATRDAKCRGEVAWPDTLPLDEAVGWQTFAETARLIAEKGRDLPAWLEAEANRAFASIEPAERRETAQRLFAGALRVRHYAYAARLVAHADAERAKLPPQESREITATIRNGTDFDVAVTITASGLAEQG